MAHYEVMIGLRFIEQGLFDNELKAGIMPAHLVHWPILVEAFEKRMKDLNNGSINKK